MGRTTPLATADQARNARPDDQMVEVVSTVLVRREAASPAHDETVDRLSGLLSAHVEAANLGAVFRAPWPVEISRFDLVRPDLCFVAWGRDGVIRLDGVYGAPDLVVEVVSPESRRRDEGEKKRLYQWARVPEYWLVDPDAKTFQAFTRAPQGYQPIPLDGDRFASALFIDLGFEVMTIFPAGD